MLASPSFILLSHFHIDYNLESPRLQPQCTSSSTWSLCALASVMSACTERANHFHFLLSSLSVCIFAVKAANVFMSGSLSGFDSVTATLRVCFCLCVWTGVVSIPQPEESEEEADGSEGGHSSADSVRCRAEQCWVLRHQVSILKLQRVCSLKPFASTESLKAELKQLCKKLKPDLKKKHHGRQQVTILTIRMHCNSKTIFLPPFIYCLFYWFSDYKSQQSSAHFFVTEIILQPMNNVF